MVIVGLGRKVLSPSCAARRGAAANKAKRLWSLLARQIDHQVGNRGMHMEVLVTVEMWICRGGGVRDGRSSRVRHCLIFAGREPCFCSVWG